MAKATALDKARRVRQHPKPKSRSAQIGPDGPKHPGNRQLYDKRGCPDAGACLKTDCPNPKVATFYAALWLTFALPLTAALISGWFVRRDQKFYGIDRPHTQLAKTDVERISVHRLASRYGSNFLTDEVLRLAIRKAIDLRHSDRERSIPVWTGQLLCRPGDENRVIWLDGAVALNTWRTPRYRAEAPNVEPDYGVAGEFFDRLIPRSEERRMFLDWLAWCLQNEGDKPAWAPFFYSGTKGSGKSTACQLAVRLFGDENSVTQNSVDKLVARFNSALLNSKLVVSEELKLRPDSSQGNTLKSYITESSMLAEQKGREPERVDQYCCFLFTTNHLPLWIENGDRRYYVIAIDHDGHASGPNSAEFTELVGRLHAFMSCDRAIAGLYRALLARELAEGFNAKSLNVETCATSVMRRIHGAARQTIVDQLEEMLNHLNQHVVPEADVAQIVREKLKANVNSTKHLMSELSWTKAKVKWGSVDFARAIWIRPGFSVEGGKLIGEDGTVTRVADHLAASDERAEAYLVGGTE